MSEGLPTVLVVAVALIDADGRVLIAQRPEGKQLADYPMPPADEPLVAWLRDLL